MQVDSLLNDLYTGNRKALARCITLVENENALAAELLQQLHWNKNTVVAGITGPPGAGKSTLINALTKHLLQQNKSVAIVAIDPTSPFNYGALLGDRIRMMDHFNSEQVFIRSMASRGSLGGLAPRVYETVDLLKAAGFDYVIIETVGVGQSEVEIAGLADTCVLVLVPEAGDEIQTIKSGIMEIADVFVVNKADRDGADLFYKNIATLAHSQQHHGWESPVVKTVAMRDEGVQQVADAIDRHQQSPRLGLKKNTLLTEKAISMIRNYRTRDIDRKQLQEAIGGAMNEPGFNLYKFVANWY